MIFAQIPTATALGMGNWLVDGAAILAIVLIVLKIVEHFQDRKSVPQPLVIQEHPEFVTREEHEKDMTALRTQMTQIHTDAVLGRSNLHKHMEAVKTDTHADIGKVKSELAEMPERIINLLLKTKGLIS